MSRSDADQLATAFLVSYSAAWASIVQKQNALLKSRQQRRDVRALVSEISAQMDALDEQANEWVSSSFPLIYGYGALEADPGFEWTPDHVAAVTPMAEDLYARLYGATSGVVRSSYKWSRTLPLDESKGITAVIYKGGARHGLADYVEMLVRTGVSLAFNKGTITAGKALGIEFYEISDGPGCGLDTHDSLPSANGMIVSADSAFAHPLAHPRCQRSFSPRRDLTSQEQADAAQGEPDTTTTPAEPSPAQERLGNRLAQRDARLAARNGRIGA